MSTIIDKKTIMTIREKYNWFCFSGDIAVVETKEGKWGFVDKAGKEVCEIEYDTAWSFKEGLARVRKEEKYGFIDETGKVVIPLVYNEAEDFYGGFARVKKGRKWSYINKVGDFDISFVKTKKEKK